MPRSSSASDVAAVVYDVDEILCQHRFLPDRYSTHFSAALDAPQNARFFAMRAHGDQLCGELPFVIHLDQVTAVLTT